MPKRAPTLSMRAPNVRKSWKHRASAAERGYGREHRAIRKQLLEEEPLCQECQEQGRVTPATIADHVIPLAEGGKTERSNYRALCAACSRSKTARESTRGRIKNFADRRP